MIVRANHDQILNILGAMRQAAVMRHWQWA